jgi:D-3-phosphoglycerate dehydrogenase / 2-oxoglutarate reductase
MASWRVLITTRSFRKTPGKHQDILSEAGCEMVNSPLDRPLEASELAELLPGIDAAILGVDQVSAEAFAKADRLKVISRYGVGVDRVDLTAATEKGVVVTNTPGGNTNAVAELTLAFMLALARNIPSHDRKIRHDDDWSLMKGVELAGKTLGLLGIGRIGQRVAELAQAFQMQILFCDPYPPAPEFVQRVGVQVCTQEHLFAHSDFLSLHLPLTPETRGIVSADGLASMKRSAFLINTARGGLVDESALFTALQTGTIAGAAFDTFEAEPSTGNPLTALPNFISTPHIGSSTEQTTLRMGLMAAENALAVLRGERPEYVVNPQVYVRQADKERPE